MHQLVPNIAENKVVKHVQSTSNLRASFQNEGQRVLPFSTIEVGCCMLEGGFSLFYMIYMAGIGPFIKKTKIKYVELIYTTYYIEEIQFKTICRSSTFLLSFSPVCLLA